MLIQKIIGDFMTSSEIRHRKWLGTVRKEEEKEKRRKNKENSKMSIDENALNHGIESGM